MQYSNSFAVRRYNCSTTFSELGSFLQISKTFFNESLKLAFLLYNNINNFKLFSYSPAPFPLMKTPSASFICAKSVLSSSAITNLINFYNLYLINLLINIIFIIF